MKPLKALTYIVATVSALFLAFAIAIWSWFQLEYHLPSDQHALEQFNSQRADYIQFAELLRENPSATYVDSDGTVQFNGNPPRLIPEYKHLVQKIGAKYVQIRNDGSIEFALWGNGCAICSDSYKGIRFDPNPQSSTRHSVWGKTVVSSLEGTTLPKENGKISSGLYIIPIEPEWFIYRLEIQE